MKKVKDGMIPYPSKSVGPSVRAHPFSVEWNEGGRDNGWKRRREGGRDDGRKEHDALLMTTATRIRSTVSANSTLGSDEISRTIKKRRHTKQEAACPC